jgi:hypothetical protein
MTCQMSSLVVCPIVTVKFCTVLHEEQLLLRPDLLVMTWRTDVVTGELMRIATLKGPPS